MASHFIANGCLECPQIQQHVDMVRRDEEWYARVLSIEFFLRGGGGT